MIGDSYGKAQLTGGGATPEQVALDGTRKQVEEAMESKSLSSIPHALSQLLPPGSFSHESCPDVHQGHLEV